ncbi:MAG: hypothetical protein ACI4A3_07520 [Lachnospiraceae bacterium]
MTEFDKRIKELSRNVEIPKEYNQKVEDVLNLLPEEEEPPAPHKSWMNKRKLALAACLICIFCLLKVSSLEVNANIFETFRLTIMDIFNIGEEEENLGVESKTEEIESKPDLFVELKEKVIDGQGIYLLVKITAPANVEFNKEISFDYFAFCEGENYNADKLIGGARDCYLLEGMEEKPNVATYVVNLTADTEELEGKDVTVCFKDLTADPNGDNPKLLVEGMWSITFLSELTVKDSIIIEGNSDMVFPFVNTTATVENIELTPLGMTLLSDVSKVPYEDLGISDTSIAIRLKMIDGSEKYISPYDPDKEYIVDSGSIEYDQNNEQSFQKNIFSFSEALDIAKVVGIYIQDLYVPVE